jgi:hypothetical protein
MNDDGSVIASGGEFRNNVADISGGAVWNADGGMVSLADTLVTGNAAPRGGGFLNVGTLGLIEVTISGNNCRTTGGRGGGIYNLGEATLEGTGITGNDVGFDGGGIYNESAGTVTFTLGSGSFVTLNTANHDGGGIYNDGGAVNLNGTTLSGNMPNNCAGSTVPGCA